MLIPSNPVVKAELEDINVLIRQERARLWDLEDQGEEPSYFYLDYLESEKERGVDRMVVNL
jgi:hypothetical protein